MMLKVALLPALACLAYAESTVTSMFIYGADKQPLAASIIANDATATTYSINCPPGTDGSECGMGPGMTVVDAGDAMTYIMDDRDLFHLTASCPINGKSAVCTESAGGPDANFPGVYTSTVEVSYMPVTITAGSITSAETSTSSARGSATTSSSSSSGAEATATSAAASETGESSTPTGGVPQITGNAGMIFGGAAVALLGAVL